MAIEWMNYHHLLYFWMVAKEGSITKASKQLLLAQPTISGQIRALEESLGDKLFAKSGRNLILTDFGRMVYRYADEIFTIGGELTDVVKGRPASRATRLQIGVSSTLPAALTARLLEPLFRQPEAVKVESRVDQTDRLLADLSLKELDLVFTDEVQTGEAKVRVCAHPLGTTPLTLLGAHDYASRFQEGFPDSLARARMLLPAEGTPLRDVIDQCLAAYDVLPEVAGEVPDLGASALLAKAANALFAAPTVVADEMAAAHGLHVAGIIPDARYSCYAMTLERKLKHPLLGEAIRSVQRDLFSTVAVEEPVAAIA